MDIIFNPSVNNENQYIQLMVRELRTKGYQVHELGGIFSSFNHFRSIRLIHLNWFENVDDRSFFAAFRSFLRKMFVLIVIRMSGKPLVWTMHNRTSHEKGPAFFSRTLTRLLVRWSQRIVIHSRQSSDLLLTTYGTEAGRKAVYIPHPHFIGVYGAARPAIHHGGDVLHLLFTGMVKPYKNLELLIDVVEGLGTEVQLTIAGRAVDGRYQAKLAKRVAQAVNVHFSPYFIPDDAMAALLADADALVLPYDFSSSLNSGTVILAASYKRTVICPDIGTVADLGDCRQYVFHYHYATVAEHRSALEAQVTRAVAEKRADPAALDRMGTQLYACIAAANDPQRVGGELHKTYQELLERRA